MINDIVPPLQSCPEHGHGSERKGGRIHSSKSPEMGVGRSFCWKLRMAGFFWLARATSQGLSSSIMKESDWCRSSRLESCKKEKRDKECKDTLSESASPLNLSLCWIDTRN